MADILSAIRTQLVASSGVTDLVSTRIVAGPLTQKITLPAMSINWVAGLHLDHLGGLSGYAEARVQVDSYSDVSAVQANSVREQARLALTGVGCVTWGGVYVHYCGDASDIPQYESPIEGERIGRFVAGLDVQICYAEATA